MRAERSVEKVSVGRRTIFFQAILPPTCHSVRWKMHWLWSQKELSSNPESVSDQLHDLEQIINSFQPSLPHLQNGNRSPLTELNVSAYILYTLSYIFKNI